MDAKQNDEKARINQAHKTRSLLEAIGVHLTGNEFIGLVKSLKNVKQTYDLAPRDAKTTYHDKTGPVCILSERQIYFMNEDIKNGQPSKRLCGPEVYFRDGEYHIAYF